MPSPGSVASAGWPVLDASSRFRSRTTLPRTSGPSDNDRRRLCLRLWTVRAAAAIRQGSQRREESAQGGGGSDPSAAQARGFEAETADTDGGPAIQGVVAEWPTAISERHTFGGFGQG